MTSPLYTVTRLDRVATWKVRSGSSSFAFSAKAMRRATNSRRSMSWGVQPNGALTMTCSMRGSDANAEEPSTEVSSGTLRQPATPRVSRSMCFSRIFRERLAWASSWLRNTMPTANCSSSRMPSSAATARKNERGKDIRTPQPSPVLPSASTAPRCVMRVSAEQAVLTSSWLCMPRMCAISPNPQLSFESSGRYRPLLLRSVGMPYSCSSIEPRMIRGSSILIAPRQIERKS